MNLPASDTIRRAEGLHDDAMDCAERAAIARLNGDSTLFERETQAALYLESQAAALVAPMEDFEPSRSVVLRSAAALALDIKDWRLAEKFACLALSGDPPDEIATELRDILEQCQFDHHFNLRDVELSEEEAILTIAGPSVGPGLIPYREFKQRADAIDRMCIRTAERRLGLPYQEGSYRPNARFNDFGTFFGLSRAASYAMSVRVGSEQMALPGLSLAPDEVLNEIVTCVDLLNGGVEALQRHIVDITYARNFLALCTKMAPDGARVRTVGLTVLNAGEPRTVTIPGRVPRAVSERRVGGTLKLVADDTGQQVSRDAVVGYLRLANKLNRKSTIGLETETEGVFNVSVPPGMMTDIVKPLWDERVRVTGTVRGKHIDLDYIEPYSGEGQESTNSR